MYRRKYRTRSSVNVTWRPTRQKDSKGKYTRKQSNWVGRRMLWNEGKHDVPDREYHWKEELLFPLLPISLPAQNKTTQAHTWTRSHRHPSPCIETSILWLEDDVCLPLRWETKQTLCKSFCRIWSLVLELRLQRKFGQSFEWKSLMEKQTKDISKQLPRQ